MAGSFCEGTLAVYKDGACSTALPFENGITSLKSQCFDLSPAGNPLGSKDVTKPTYHPGTCSETGGEPTGVVSPAAPSTFCCLSA